MILFKNFRTIIIYEYLFFFQSSSQSLEIEGIISSEKKEEFLNFEDTKKRLSLQTKILMKNRL